MHKVTSISLAFTLLFSSCSIDDQSEQMNSEAIELDEAKVASAQKEFPLVGPEEAPVFEVVQSESFRIPTPDFDLYIAGYDGYFVKGRKKITRGDTIFVESQLGERVEGSLMKIVPKNGEDFVIYQSHINNLSIMNEGPHCDLVDWKYYQSEPTRLETKNGVFIADAYLPADYSKFVDVNMEEFRQAVEEHCGADWRALIEDIDRPTKYPSGVMLSTIVLKVVYSMDGEEKEQLIYVEVPMGC